MARIKGKDTKPEKVVRSILHRMGYRFRLHVRNLPGKPDIVFSRHRKIIFVNGCFWHGHKACRKKTLPKSNRAFWSLKIGGNIRRDEQHRKQLKKERWRVLIIWECEISDVVKTESKLTKFMKS